MLFKFIQCIVFGVLSSQLAIHHLRFLGVFFFLFTVHVQNIEGLPVGSVSKDSSCNIGDTGSIPGLGRSPREGNSNPLQYSHLGNPMDRRAWRATVHGVTKQSDMTEQLNNNSNSYIWLKLSCYQLKIHCYNYVLCKPYGNHKVKTHRRYIIQMIKENQSIPL